MATNVVNGYRLCEWLQASWCEVWRHALKPFGKRLQRDKHNGNNIFMACTSTTTLANQRTAWKAI
eukprot:363779-Chlamydomonas_euryale.AAC.2